MDVVNLSIAPEYLSFYLAGRRDVDIPLDLDYRRIASTRHCINIPCLYWSDGNTAVSIGHFDDIAQASTADFDGILETPDRKLILFDANEPNFATISVIASQTRIRIWIDHPTEPENVFIAWGD